MLVLKWILGNGIEFAIMSLFLCLNLKPKLNKTVSFLIVFLTMLLAGLTYRLTDSISMSFSVIFTLVAFIVYSFVLFKDNIKTKMFVCFMILCIVYIISFFVTLTMKLYSFDTENENSTFPWLIVINVAVTLLLSLFTYIRKNVIKENIKSKDIWAFILFPLSQAAVLCSTSMALNTKNVFGTGRHLAILGNDKRISMVFILIACGISLAADIILFIVIHRSNQKEKLNEELKLKEYQNRLNLEYYKSAEENALEARKIRHDLANVVEIMSALLESGEKENKQRADELMQQLKMSISDIHVEKYSENSLVNAIIANKAAACRNNNVTAEFNINVPETLNVEEIDVCKAYVNVIDNAMNAASQLEGDDRKLQIDSYVNNGYLYIKSMNKSNEEKKKEPNKLHGYGQKILQDIAGKYSGKFITDFENNLYSALLTMKV